MADGDTVPGKSRVEKRGDPLFVKPANCDELCNPASMRRLTPACLKHPKTFDCCLLRETGRIDHHSLSSRSFLSGSAQPRVRLLINGIPREWQGYRCLTERITSQMKQIEALLSEEPTYSRCRWWEVGMRVAHDDRRSRHAFKDLLLDDLTPSRKSRGFSCSSVHLVVSESVQLLCHPAVDLVVLFP